MSKLIDVLIRHSHDNVIEVEINGEWYIAKPLGTGGVIHRIKDAWEVLTGKAQAYHYKQDEVVSDCIRVGYDMYECQCDKCIELDRRREGYGKN